MKRLIIIAVLLAADPASAEAIHTTQVVNQTPVTTVSALPTCNAGLRGRVYLVTDALAPVTLAALSGGGAVVVKTYCNGTSWIVG